jgi:hypothetical protein
LPHAFTVKLRRLFSCHKVVETMWAAAGGYDQGTHAFPVLLRPWNSQLAAGSPHDGKTDVDNRAVMLRSAKKP